jgi:hypothetical protein
MRFETSDVSESHKFPSDKGNVPKFVSEPQKSGRQTQFSQSSRHFTHTPVLPLTTLKRSPSVLIPKTASTIAPSDPATAPSPHPAPLAVSPPAPAMPSSRRPSASGLTGDDLAPPPPQNGTGTGASPAQSSTSNESFYSAAPDVALNGAGGALKGPWNRVDVSLQKDFAREKKAGKLTFERKVELYGEKLEDKFKELEERLLCREEEVLLKGRELQRTLALPLPPPPRLSTGEALF